MWTRRACPSWSVRARRRGRPLRGGRARLSAFLASRWLLRLTGSTDLGGGAVYLETVNDGKTLVAAYFGDNRMTTHDMSGGTNPFRETERQSTPSEPHQIIAAPSGLLYVPHRSADVVRWFSVDAGGKLQQRGEWKAKKGDGACRVSLLPDCARVCVGPRHMTFFGSNAYCKRAALRACGCVAAHARCSDQRIRQHGVGV